MLKVEDQSIMDPPKKRILVVEDDAQMSKFIQFKLAYLGYHVVGDAGNSEDACDKADLLKPDLILMDIMLEGEEDGIETAQLITERQHVPIVYLTAHEDEVLFERARITEPFGYLIKPFNDRDLRIVIETALFRDDADKRIKGALEALRNILDSAVDIMITYDLDGHIIEFNRAAVEAFGLNRHAAKKMMIASLISDEKDRSILLNGDPLAVHKHEAVHFQDHESQSFSADLILSPLTQGDGKVQGRLLVARIH